MKKFIAILLSIILIGGIVTGIVFGVKACNDKKADGNNTVSEMLMLKDEYTVGDKIIFDFYVYSDVQFKSITYSLNNGTEQSITGATTGESTAHEHYRKGGKYFIDTGATIIETDDMTAGYYTLVFYCADAENVKYQVPSKPYLIKLKAAAAA